VSSKVIPIRLNNEIIREIDLLIELGVFSSRSEALRHLIKLGMKDLKRDLELFKLVEKLEELEKDEGGIPIKLHGATRQLLSDREKIP